MFKVIDSYYTVPTPVADTGYYSCLNLCAQGYTNGKRVGSVIHCSLLELSIICKQHMTPQSCMNGRVLTILDTQSNGTIPTDATVFQTISGINTINSFINFNYIDRYRIIDDWVVSFAADVGGSNIGFDRPRNRQVKIPLDIDCVYGTNTGTYTDILTNAIWTVCINDNADTSYMRAVFNSRLWYKDK